MQRQPLQTFVQQFDLLNVIELDNLCMHLTDHLQYYLEQEQISLTKLQPGQCTKALILTIRDVINKSAQKDHMLRTILQIQSICGETSQRQRISVLYQKNL